jgi:hypothetical protein
MRVDAQALDALDLPLDGIVCGPISGHNPLGRFFPEHLDLFGCCYFHGHLGPTEQCPKEFLGEPESDGSPPVVLVTRTGESVTCNRRCAPSGPWEHSLPVGGRIVVQIPRSQVRLIGVIDPSRVPVAAGTVAALRKMADRGALRIGLVCPSNQKVHAAQMLEGLDTLPAADAERLELVVLCARGELPRVWRSRTKRCT